MQIQASLFAPGMYSLAHHHSGVEAVYVLDGEACFETPTGAVKLKKGETAALPTGTPMRSVAIGSKSRYVFGIILYDAAQAATMPEDEGTGPRLVACR